MAQSQSNSRYFKTYFYDDPYVQSLSLEEQTVFQYLILNAYNNVGGVYEITLRRISMHTKLSEEVIKQSLFKLSSDGKISYSENWIALKNFLKNQNLSPTMHYKSFMIWKDAPKDKLYFVFTNIDGNLEEWAYEWIEKVEEGFNQTEMSKYRAQLKKSKDKGLDIPSIPEKITFGLDEFSDKLIKKSPKQVLDGNIKGLPPTIPPNIPKGYPPRIGEMEVETEIEMEYEKEGEREECTQPPENEFTPPPPMNDPKYKLQLFLDFWNEFVPQQKTSSMANINPDIEIMNFVIQCDFEEYKTCVKHYAEAYQFNKSRIGGFLKSLKPSFISNWFSEDSVENRKQLSESFGDNKKQKPDFEDDRKF